MTAAGRQPREGLSIGAVLAQLRKDFPGVTISKIRFLESEGLVRPARTPSGYRQFTSADVERLRFVLTAQRDHYLPLKVIKEQLEAADRGAAAGREPTPDPGSRPARRLVPLDAPDTGVPAPTADDFAGDATARLSSEELLAEAEIDEALLAELVQYGLIRPGAGGFYDADAVTIAKTVTAMGAFGIEPRHLRALRVSADREVGLLEQVAAPVYRHRDEGARERGDELVRELAALSVTLHTLLVKAGIRGLTHG
ncbi:MULTISPECIES: transcriptional regulator FtsR [Prauserella salsuginis group]|uniref:MerR family transcriptional regulator n=1 Tax=Prauserella salsuginis TaxID=387889 RepID=A0ABW6G473_9PSEU|nr:MULTISPECIES: MerR family transcriptional regulator [Prauserella salsuginis group]MCR3718268.1 MerR family regulatory protein [Prauserella flava]MCR3732838.1 MerR family regulatory protein [Prauserella salsuginis]